MSGTRPRPSTAPIALLLTAGLILLGFSATLPASTEVTTYPDTVTAGEPTVAHTVTTTDPVWTTVAIVLLVLAVAAFGGAGWLGYRRWRR